MRALPLLALLAVGCTASDDATDADADDQTADADDDDDTDTASVGPVNLDGRWVLDVVEVRGNCDEDVPGHIGFDVVRLGDEDFQVTLINQQAPAYGSVAVNHGCDGSGDVCFVAISLVTVVDGGDSRLTSFGVDVAPDGAIDGKLFVHEERTTGICEDNYVVTGQIE